VDSVRPGFKLILRPRGQVCHKTTISRMDAGSGRDRDRSVEKSPDESGDSVTPASGGKVNHIFFTPPSLFSLTPPRGLRQVVRAGFATTTYGVQPVTDGQGNRHRKAARGELLSRSCARAVLFGARRRRAGAFAGREDATAPQRRRDQRGKAR
jgi:hypothetical protein